MNYVFHHAWCYGGFPINTKMAWRSTRVHASQAFCFINQSNVIWLVVWSLLVKHSGHMMVSLESLSSRGHCDFQYCGKQHWLKSEEFFFCNFATILITDEFLPTKISKKKKIRLVKDNIFFKIQLSAHRNYSIVNI